MPNNKDFHKEQFVMSDLFKTHTATTGQTHSKMFSVEELDKLFKEIEESRKKMPNIKIIEGEFMGKRDILIFVGSEIAEEMRRRER